MIVGGLVVGVIFIVAIIMLVVFLVRRHKNGNIKIKTSNVGGLDDDVLLSSD